MKPLVTIDNLTVAFGNHTIIKSLNCKVMQGDFFIICGDNGVGKTTLIRTLLGSVHPQTGTINLPEERSIGYVPQFRNLDQEYPLSIREFVGLNYQTALLPWTTRQERLARQNILQKTNLTQLQNQPLGLASGGEKQRAYLAQALINQPQLLILDEATASLDNSMKFELLNLVTKFRQKGLTVILVTHDLPLARQYGNRFLYMTKDGYQEGPINDLPNWKGEK
ncbi:metal ABC transporter ATP-binding protein [uncultured Limosilactobacillus sp.]|uniref:metal ABC transporter ATP-binding protein n=1 Tax=uncultured Limosilactobacillus sp. TaxID=2837629 RepID=UPI0025F2CF9B|nr:ATP-binding cassette domain-containing protein [uncultured Limosilactobacillus sp.]